MNKLFGRCAIFLAGSIACASNAAVYSTNPTIIARVDTYTQYGGGDVIFTLSNSSLAASCPSGFWIRATDGAGAKTTIAQVMAAQHAGNSVVVYADTSIAWSGAGSPACLVWTVQVPGL
jgi:hypothetical protein